MLYIWKGRKKMFFPHFYIGELQFLSRDWKNVCVYARAEERERFNLSKFHLLPVTHEIIV